MFSSIIERFDAPTNPLYLLRDQLRAKGHAIIDLVSGNVSSQGIQFPETILKRALQEGLRKTKIYKPDPLGQVETRRAISRFYAAEGLDIPADQLLITPGTSLSYLYAFKLLADPGDEVLCPSPCYPLFDAIAALSGVKLVPYYLRERARWEIDFAHLGTAITPRTKAIILISPHNPTGAVASLEEVEKLSVLAAKHRLAIISDEVFSPFLYSSSPADTGRGPMVSPPKTAGNDGRRILPRPANTKAPLVITLNGLSKMLALPGFKIGWMAVSGEDALVKKALKALDMISDTFLPVNEIAQSAVPPLLNQSGKFLATYVKTMTERMRLAASLLNARTGVSFIEPEGGFFLTLKVDGEEEERALRLLKTHQILVHPGYFYDMEGSHLVFSFASKPSILRRVLKVL